MMKQMQTKIVVGATLLAGVIGQVAEVRAADYTLRFSHWVPATHIIHKTVEQWAGAVENASGGRIDVQIFPAQQIGAAKDHYTMTAQGVVDGAWVAPGYSPGRFPVIAAGEIPFLVTNGSSGSEAFDSWYRPHAEKEMSDVYYCAATVQEPGVLHSAKPIEDVKDLTGLKLRVATATLGKYFGSLGAAPVSIPAPEVRAAAEKGVVGAVTYGWKTSQALGVTAAFKNHLDYPIYSVPTVYLLSKAFYQKLPKDLKAVIDEACSSDMAGKLGKIWADWEAAGKTAISKDEGRNIYQATAELKDGLQQAVAPALQAWRDAVEKKGLEPQKAWDDLRAVLKKHNALLD